MATKKKVISKRTAINSCSCIQASLEIDELDWDHEENTPSLYEEEVSHSKQKKYKTNEEVWLCTHAYPELTNSNATLNPKRSLFSFAATSSMIRNDPFLTLIDEVVLIIFSYLPRLSLVSVVQVCKRWKQLGYDEVLWQQVNLDSKHMNKTGVLGSILHRGVKILRLSRAEILAPICSYDCEMGCDNFALTHLDATMTKFSKDVLSSLLFKCVYLKNLSLEGGKVSLPEITAISDNIELNVLNLSQVVGLSNSAIDVITRKCSRLKSLNLSWTNQTRDAIHYICRCKHLEELNLSGLRGGINRQILESLVLSCKKLTEIDFSDVTLQIGTLKLLADRLMSLKKLSISRCSDVKAEQLLDLVPLRSLSHLNLFGFLNSEALQRFTQHRPDIFINKETFSPIARPISTVAYEGRLWEQYVGFII